MKNKLSIVFFILNGFWVVACPVCEKQQPELLKGITHGTGPTGNSDYIIIGATALIVIITFIYFIKYTFFPKEKERSHIKRKILNYER